MNKIIISLSALIVTLSIFLVGCGSDKTETATTTRTTTTTSTTEKTTEKENLEDKITSVLEDATSIFDRESTAESTTK